MKEKIKENIKEKSTTKELLRTYFTGIVTGMLIFALAIVISDITGFHPFAKYKAAELIRDRARTVESYIDKYYWKNDTTDEEFAEGAAKGMVEALNDPYSVYMTPAELTTSKIKTGGRW